MKQFAVIGLGRFGMNLAISLAEHKCQVLAIDSDKDKVKKAQGLVTQAVQLDARDADALKAVGLADMDAVVVAIGSNQESSMLATMVLKDLGVETVVAKAVTVLHGRFLEKIGADQVVYPEIDSGKRLGRQMARPNIVEQIEFGSEHGVFEIKVPGNWVGRTLGDINVRAKLGVSVLAIKGQEGAGMNVSPMASTLFESDDVILILGRFEDVQKLTK